MVQTEIGKLCFLHLFHLAAKDGDGLLCVGQFCICIRSLVSQQITAHGNHHTPQAGKRHATRIVVTTANCTLHDRHQQERQQDVEEHLRGYLVGARGVVEKLVVIEELDPIIENHCKSLGLDVHGKDMFPICGEFSQNLIAKAFGKEVPSCTKLEENIPVRPPIMCAGCPHRGMFYALSKLKVTVLGDIGCYTLGSVAPLSAMDMTLCMGASISGLHGFNKALGKDAEAKTVAIIGDSTFMHSGMTGLATVAYNQSNSTIIIVDNSITGMTGHQQNPTTGKNLYGEPAGKVDLEALVKALGINSVKVVDPYNIAECEQVLKEELDILSNVQELKEGSYSSYYALYGDNQSIVEALSKIKYTISTLAQLDKNLKETESILFDAYENLKESANFLRDYSSNLELNPQRLDELNERISLIQKLKRKYGADLDFERNNIEKKLNELTSDDNDIEKLEENYNSLYAQINLLAERIEEYRTKNAKELSTLIEEKLKNLELKEAQFDISIQKIPNNELGQNNVEFLISTNKNQNPMPLSRVASGGEISRVMLALKTIFANVDKVKTVVFDEIDTGISGITSNSVAQNMIELSKETQIICITHQPIICAKADNFIWITKTHNDETDIKIETLNEENKLKALAQLASGEINEKTLEFAKTLI